MMSLSFAHVTPVIFLVLSNLFMTVAWYGHLKFKSAPLLIVIVASWAIAFVEYCLAVPANRIGAAVYTLAQLKTIQEVVTLTVFVGFAAVVFGEMPTWRTVAGFVLIAAGAALVFTSGKVA